jgi:RNA polymerase sigma-70 factor (sigma-E family)
VTEFEERFPGLYRVAYRVAFRIVGQREEAEDVAQEVLARALVRWPKVHDRAEAWVARVSGNLAIGVWRHVARRKPPMPQPPPPSAEALVIDRADLVRALQSISRRQREVVVLRYLADLPEDAVADAIGCSVGTVKQHASRGLAALRAPLADR